MLLKHSPFSVLAQGAGFAVYRDDKALETPLHFQLIVPTQALAKAIAAEFEVLDKKADVRKMPLMQMALTTIDISMRQREKVINGIMLYGETELICQRAADPADLVEEQNKIWQPFLDWVKKRFKVDLRTGSGILPFKQNESALAALRAHVETLDVFFLTGLSEACSTLGSLVLGLALIEGQSGVAGVFEAAELDQNWQSKKWGDDPVSRGRQAEIRRDLEVCALWIKLLGK